MRIKNFIEDTNGNIAIILGLTILPMLLAVGAGVDLLRQNNANTLLQAAADSAVLAIASSRKEGSDAKNFASEYLRANGGFDIIKTVNTFNVEADKVNGLYTVRLNGTVNTSFMSLAGIPTLKVGAYSEVALGQPKPLELALVLDNTGSMGAEGRMGALKIAAHRLVDKLKSVLPPNTSMADTDDENATQSETAALGNIKVGVVPFAQYVNVGVQYRGEPWLDVPDDWVEKILVPGNAGGEVCGTTYPNAVSSDCHQVTIPTGTATSCNDGICTTYTTGGGTQTVCNNYDPGEPVESCWTNEATEDKIIEVPHVWHGCVGSRDNPLDTKVSEPGTPYKGFLDLQCTIPLLPLTRNFDSVKNVIDFMSPVGETYLGPGVVWGWNLLEREAPFTQARSQQKMDEVKGLKVMVLMTDGQNTKSASYPTHDGTDGNEANNITASACENAKAAGIMIYTVGFKVPSESGKTLLRNCASEPENYFDAATDADLAESFDYIAGQLLTLRLTK